MTCKKLYDKICATVYKSNHKQTEQQITWKTAVFIANWSFGKLSGINNSGRHPNYFPTKGKYSRSGV